MIQTCKGGQGDKKMDGTEFGVMDDAMVKLYHSILNSRKKQSLQDNNRTLQSTPNASKERPRPKTPFYEIRESPMIRERKTPLSVKYVYLSQTKPHPIEPLKAWKGYNGNLYFQPITINRCSSTTDSLTYDHNSTLPSTSYSNSKSAPTKHSRSSWTETSLQHPAIKLEREAVMSRLSMTLSTDGDEGHCQKHSGTLILGTAPSTKAKSKKKPQLYKGSMVHQLKKWKNSKGNSTYGYRYTSKGKPSSAKSTLLIASKGTRKNTGV